MSARTHGACVIGHAPAKVTRERSERLLVPDIMPTHLLVGPLPTTASRASVWVDSGPLSGLADFLLYRKHLTQRPSRGGGTFVALTGPGYNYGKICPPQLYLSLDLALPGPGVLRLLLRFAQSRNKSCCQFADALPFARGGVKPSLHGTK